MKILAIEPSGRLYGSEYCLLDILRATREAGVNWEVVLPGGGGFDRVLQNEGFPAATFLPPDSHKLSRLRKLPAYLRLRRQIQRSAPDLVYLNQAGMLRALTASLMGMRLPVVCQVQTLEDARFISRFPGIGRNVKAFICNSQYIAAETRVPEDRRCVLYQGYRFGPMLPAPAAPGPGMPWRFGILGRIAPSKGHALFLAAARLLVERETGREFVFTVIGEGLTPADTNWLRRLVEEQGMSRHFEFRGYRTAVTDELARLHGLVIPSPAEPLGRVLLEAAAAGIPAVVSDSGGLGEFSRNLQIGFRFEAGNTGSLAAALTAMIHDYPATVTGFREACLRFHPRMNPSAYMEAVMQILRRAANWENSAVAWLGDAAAPGPDVAIRER